jgi:hypothetical protein
VPRKPPGRLQIIVSEGGILKGSLLKAYRKMPHLHVQRSELTYEAVLSPSFGTLIDTPGRVLSALLSEFDHLDVGVSDVSMDDGPLEDTGLSCEVEKLDANVVIRADRVEIRFFSIDETGDGAAEAIRGVWKVIACTSPEVTAKSHSLLFEMDCELLNGSYRAALEPFCRPHESLPQGTETAVVYYLPPDASQGFLDSSFVLNRSAEVEGGVLLAVTLVFEGKHSRPDELIHAGRKRLADLLRSLDIAVVQDSKATG